jgi:hypothetical protein
MITEEQFTTAMERAVEKRGAEWRYPPVEQAPPGFYIGQAYNSAPTYSDGEGNPTCLIGAAMRELGMSVPVPEYSPSALALLMGKMTMKVAMAARCAQVHQDLHNPWGQCLAVYRAALEVLESRTFSEYEAHTAYHLALRHMKGESVSKATPELQRLIESFGKVQVSLGSTATNVATFTNTFFDGYTAKGGMTITGISIVNTAGKVLVDIPEVGLVPKSLLTKGQHALIA